MISEQRQQEILTNMFKGVNRQNTELVEFRKTHGRKSLLEDVTPVFRSPGQQTAMGYGEELC